MLNSINNDAPMMPCLGDDAGKSYLCTQIRKEVYDSERSNHSSFDGFWW